MIVNAIAQRGRAPMIQMRHGGVLLLARRAGGEASQVRGGGAGSKNGKRSVGGGLRGGESSKRGEKYFRQMTKEQVIEWLDRMLEKGRLSYIVSDPAFVNFLKRQPAGNGPRRVRGQFVGGVGSSQSEADQNELRKNLGDLVRANALKEARRAAAAAVSAGDADVASAYGRLVGMLAAQGNLDEALEAVDEAVETAGGADTLIDVFEAVARGVGRGVGDVGAREQLDRILRMMDRHGVEKCESLLDALLYGLAKVRSSVIAKDGSQSDVLSAASHATSVMEQAGVEMSGTACQSMAVILANAGQPRDAAALLQQQREDIPRRRGAFNVVLAKLVEQGENEEARRLLKAMVEGNGSGNGAVGIDMYTARSIVNQLAKKPYTPSSSKHASSAKSSPQSPSPEGTKANAASSGLFRIWTTRIAILAKTGKLENAESMVRWMKRAGVRPQATTLVPIVHRAAADGEFEKAREWLHTIASLESSAGGAGAVVGGRGGDWVPYARGVEVLVTGLINFGRVEEARETVAKIRRAHGSSSVAAAALRPLVEWEAHNRGAAAAVEVLNRNGEEDGGLVGIETWNRLLRSLVGASRLAHVSDLWAEMETRGLRPDGMSYGALVGSEAQQGRWSKAWDILDSISPDRASPSHRAQGQTVDFMPAFEAMMRALCEAVHVDSARETIERLKGLVGRERACGIRESLYAPYINMLAARGEVAAAKGVVEEMRARMELVGGTTYEALLRGMERSGRIEEAWEVLRQETREDREPKLSRDSWHAFLGFAARTSDEKAVEPIMARMRQRGLLVDHVTFSTIVAGLADSGKDMVQVREALARMGMSLEGLGVDLQVHSLLVRELCKGGAFVGARKKMDEMMKRQGIVANLHTYGGMVNELAKQGHWQQVNHVIARIAAVGLSPNGQILDTLVRNHAAQGRLGDLEALIVGDGEAAGEFGAGRGGGAGKAACGRGSGVVPTIRTVRSAIRGLKERLERVETSAPSQASSRSPSRSRTPALSPAEAHRVRAWRADLVERLKEGGNIGRDAYHVSDLDIHLRGVGAYVSGGYM